MLALSTQMVKNLPAMQKTRVQSLGWEEALEKGMANHSSILAWRIPWTDHGVAESDMTERLTYTVYIMPLVPLWPSIHIIMKFFPKQNFTCFNKNYCCFPSKNRQLLLCEIFYCIAKLLI